MATDGVKILESDVARDTYSAIMDLYDSGVEVDQIRQAVPFARSDYGSESNFYHEQFVTSYALALWEIGGLTADIAEEVRHVVDLTDGVRIWTEEAGEAEGRKRQKVLETFLTKIGTLNKKIRKRKKYRTIENLFFQPDEVLAFQLSDGCYCAAICAKVTQQRGQCTYDLVATTFKSFDRPTITQLIDCDILGRKISSGYDLDNMLLLQPGLKEVWKHFSCESNFLIGMSYDLVPHKHLASFKSNFEVIGHLRIKESFKDDGSYGYLSTFEEIERKFSRLNEQKTIWGNVELPVKLICDV